MSPILPPMAPYPEASWIAHLQPDEWEACLDSWILLGGAYLALSSSESQKKSHEDDSVAAFISTFVGQMVLSEKRTSIIESSELKFVRKMCFLLFYRLLDSEISPNMLLNWELLDDARRVFGRENVSKLYSLVQEKHLSTLENSLKILRSYLIKELDAGIHGNLTGVKSKLKKLNNLLHALPEIATFFMTGSDFLDASINGFKVMNPLLRKSIISNIYLCLIGLAKNRNPRLYLLADQLYSMKIAAESHQSGLLNENDSLVCELVSATPILKKLHQGVKSSDPGFSRVSSALSSLESFRVLGKCTKSRRSAKIKIDKGKQKVSEVDHNGQPDKGSNETHRKSLVLQVQELLPDLESKFVARLLKEYEDNVELVISHLLEGSLPTHLKEPTITESFRNTEDELLIDRIPMEKDPPVLPTRHNVYDNDEFDLLTVEPSRLHFGRRNTAKNVENLLDYHSSCPQKEAIYSALRAFNQDDDEHDDTYDIADVGGTVDNASPKDDIEAHMNVSLLSVHDEALFHAYKKSPEQFERNALTRRGKIRESLRAQLGLTDEVIEGWALMIKRDSRLLRELENRFEGPQTAQPALASSAWKAGGAEDDEQEEMVIRTKTKNGHHRMKDNASNGRAMSNLVQIAPGQDSKLTRRGKETNKSSRANHNRKAQRGKKLMRGGFSG